MELSFIVQINYELLTELKQGSLCIVISISNRNSYVI